MRKVKFLANFVTKLTILAAIATAPLFLIGFFVLQDSSQAVAAENPFNDPPAISEEDLSHFHWMQYKFFRAPDGYTAGIWAVLDPETTELPATVQVQVPEAAEVFWFGPVPEGGVTPESPQFHDYHAYIDSETGMRIYTVTLTNSYELQIEHYFWGEAFSFPVRTLPNGDHVIRISYTPLHDVETLRLAAFLPAGSMARDSNRVAFLGEGPTGDPAFAMTFVNAQGGNNYTAEIEYVPPEYTERLNRQGISGGVIAAGAAVAAAILMVAGLLFWIRLRKKRSGEESDTYENLDSFSIDE